MAASYKIESLLSARLFVNPQLVGERVHFLSDVSGKISLYAMDRAGSVPEPLLPPDIALQNPALMNGHSSYVFQKLGGILVLIDRDGDENYQPNLIPLDGGLPKPVLGERFRGKQVNAVHCDAERNVIALFVDPRTSPLIESNLLELETMELTDLGTSLYGNYFSGANEDYSRILLLDSYTTADITVYLWEKGAAGRRLLYGSRARSR
jgi:hypothetical protein